ncbi:MAG: hypothetical protein Q4D19_02235 [Lautropia sp.]|nr:hypothetical protein [Lautropia sp.]
MMQFPLRPPLSALTLAVLLAACGGSGSNSGPATGNDISSGNSAQTEKADPPAGQPTSASPEAPTAQGAPVDANGVRGDVLLSMLDHRTCQHQTLKPVASQDGPAFSPEQRAGLPDVIAETGLESPSNYQPVAANTGQAAAGNSLCSTARYSPFDDGQATLQVKTRAATSNAIRPASITLNTPISASAGTVTLGTTQQIENPGINISAAKALVSASSYSFQTSARVPYGRLTEWRDGNDFTALQLQPVPGSKPQQVRLCWNSQTVFSRQLHCQQWEIPNGWKRGDPITLKGQSLTEGRSIQEGEAGAGTVYWRSNP